MTLAQVARFLENLGWPYQIMADSVIKGQYKGLLGVTKVLFHVHESGLRIAINPIMEKPLETGAWSVSVNRLIVSLDKESPSIRIGLDREGDLYVKVDLPKQELTFEQFSYVLLNLCRVSEQLVVPVLQAQAYGHAPEASLMPQAL